MLKSRLKADSPSVLYGCGDVSQLNSGGLAVVGSRPTMTAGFFGTRRLWCARGSVGQHHCLGRGQGIDQAAMQGALDAGGRAIGVIADSLEKAVLARYNRDMLVTEKRQPSFLRTIRQDNVGNAMRRNKFIYALSNASLIVNSDVEGRNVGRRG